VAEQPEGLCPLPRRLGVGREPLVEDAEGHLEGRVAQVVVEGLELIRGAS